MARKCMECGRKKGLFARNYAGFEFRNRAAHPFPDRIEPLVLPGDSAREFLCVRCANTRKAKCRSHGEIASPLRFGSAPVCLKCRQEWEFAARPMAWRDWGYRDQGLACPYCRAACDVESGISVFAVPPGMDRLAAMKQAQEMVREPKDRVCKACGKRFQTRWAEERDASRDFYEWRPGPLSQ